MVHERSGKPSTKAALQIIRNNLDNPAIDRAIAERYAKIDNQNKENADPSGKKSKPVTVNIPNGGKSKASLSKQRQTLGAVINGAAKALAHDKATPTRYRAEGMENAMKCAPVLSKPIRDGKSYSSLLVALRIRISTNHLSRMLSKSRAA